MKISGLLATVILMLGSVYLVQAQIPRTLSYHGVLADSLDNPKPDGPYAFTFRLYTASGGGSAIWTESKSLQVKRGYFSTLLGDVSSLVTVPFDRPYWLSIEVSPDAEMASRIPLSAVGYSISSIKSDTSRYALGAPVQSVVDSARVASTVPDNAITSSKIQDGSITSAKILNSTIQFADLAQNGASSGQIMKWNGTIWTPRNDSVGPSDPWSLNLSSLYYNVGKVGIGDASPGFRLAVMDSMNGLRVQTNTPGSNLASFGGVGDFSIDSNGSLGGRLIVKENGNTGIGITNPAFRLDVGGTINAANIYRNGLPFSANQWSTSGDDIYFNSGRVGIGTSLPSSSLRDLGFAKGIRTQGITSSGYRVSIIDSLDGLRVQTNTAGGSLASFGGVGDFSIDAPYIPGGRFDVMENGVVKIGYTPRRGLPVGNAQLLVLGAGGLNIQTYTPGSTVARFGASGDFIVEGTAPEGRFVISEAGDIGIETPPDAASRVSIKAADGKTGLAVNANATGSSPAISGFNQAGGNGVYGEGGENGVWGRSANPNASGVFGQNVGGGYGVAGQTSGSGKAVYGYNVSPNGYAGYFDGTVSSSILEIRGGSDLAEPFSSEDGSDIAPGTLMVIDERHPGKLKISDQPYDAKIAGIVSGAGGIHAGLTLHQDGITSGPILVAIAGRVYCKASATNGSITPGDLLTSSRKPGHVMKATDKDRLNGTIIGKAMSALDEGEGLVLVLVNLQ